jgi:hypothetical protein
MAVFHLRAMGLQPRIARAGSYASLLGARRALARAGFASLAEAVDTEDVVSRAASSFMGHIAREKRKSIVIFCVDVDHCRRVSAELRKYGVEAPVVTANTPAKERDRIAEEFKRGRYAHLCNVNFMTMRANLDSRAASAAARAASVAVSMPMTAARWRLSCSSSASWASPSMPRKGSISSLSRGLARASA